MTKLRCQACKKKTDHEKIRGRDAYTCSKCSLVSSHFPVGKVTDRRLWGGPWDGETIGFRDDQSDLRIYDMFDDVPRYLGRYVVREIQQKNRVIKRVEWETAEDKSALVKERLRSPGIRVL